MRNSKQKLFEWRADMCWQFFSARMRKSAEIRRFLNGFGGFVAFHACRPTNVQPYYEKGIQIADHETLTAEARKIFLSGEFPEITEEEFEAITRDIPSGDDRKTYVVLDQNELLRSSGHYLIYGSEHICGIAASLMRKGGRDYRQILKRFGTPTIFRVELPVGFVPREQIDQLAHHLGEIAEDLVGCDEPPNFSWSFIFDRCVPAHYVKSHLHPTSIPDPLLRYWLYRHGQDADIYECL
jgi:hypothetical protein